MFYIITFNRGATGYCRSLATISCGNAFVFVCAGETTGAVAIDTTFAGEGAILAAPPPAAGAVCNTVTLCTMMFGWIFVTPP